MADTTAKTAKVVEEKNKDIPMVTTVARDSPNIDQKSIIFEGFNLLFIVKVLSSVFLL